jgi:serine/threonine protein kinase
VSAAVSPFRSALAPGYKLDRYELLCPIAEGGMASVWVARQRGKHGFEKLVAIKTILPKFAADVRFQEMFLDEARIASRIEHLNVAHILDLGEEDEILYLTMEYVDGDAISKLNRACQKKGVRIPPGVLLRIVADACAGLHEAHELKDSSGKLLEIVHRDVSPHNILVSTRGIAKLIDFGIAKARSRVGSDTNSGVLKGKIQYMAPEQALGRPVDRRADVWAVGAIIYQLLAGRPPYEGDNQLATLHLLGSGRPPIPLPPSVHPAVARVVRMALAYSPENRYATAMELRDAIEGAMVAARLQTTATDVAAFSAEHLAERAERRRQAIEMALAAAAERAQVEDRLRSPASERISVTSSTPDSGPRSIQALRAAESPVRCEPTLLPEARLSRFFDLPTPAESPARAAHVAPMPPSMPSYATLGSAALDASEPLLLGKPKAQAKARRGARTLMTIVAAAAVVVTGVSFTALRSRTPAATGHALVTLASPTAQPLPASVLVALAEPLAEASPSAAPGAVSAVPAGAGTPPPRVVVAPRGNASPASVPVRWTALPAATASTPVAPLPRAAPKVDDGF